jgi:alpha-tubulin suppressor-like RCC1 family protein
MLRSFVWVAAALSFAPGCKTECQPYGSVEGAWVSVSVGGNQSCGIKEDGTLLCWGGQYEDELCPPEEQFSQVSVGAKHACGVTTDQRALCWGQATDGDLDAPEGDAVEVAAGENFSCGIAASNGTVICWGNNQYGQGVTPETTKFQHIDVAQWHGCGIVASGTRGIECWGSGQWGTTQAPKDGGYVGISVGWAHSCALKDSGEILCWGGDGGGKDDKHLDEVPTGTYKRVAAGAFATCAIDSFDELVCWGDPTDGVITNPPDESFAEVAVGGNRTNNKQTQHACAIKCDQFDSNGVCEKTGKMVCWGNNDDYQATVNPDWN